MVVGLTGRQTDREVELELSRSSSRPTPRWWGDRISVRVRGEDERCHCSERIALDFVGVI